MVLLYRFLGTFVKENVLANLFSNSFRFQEFPPVFLLCFVTKLLLFSEYD
jgi:hypothetical protein